MQGQKCGLDATLLKRLKQRRVEMQTGRRRCDGTVIASVDSLVAGPVFTCGAAADVRRQRDFAVRFEKGLDVGIEFQPIQWALPAQHAGACAVGEAQFGSVAGTAAGLDLCRRRSRAGDALQQHLHPPTRVLAAAEAGADDSGVVQDEQVTGSQQTGQVRETPILR